MNKNRKSRRSINDRDLQILERLIARNSEESIIFNMRWVAENNRDNNAEAAAAADALSPAVKVMAEWNEEADRRELDQILSEEVS